MSSRSASSAEKRRRRAWWAASSCGLLVGMSGWLPLPRVKAQESAPPVATPPVAETSPSPTVAASPAAETSPAPQNEAPKEIRDGDMLQSISSEVAAILAKCKGTIVRIRATDRLGTHVGTGFFIDTNGTIYTHYSVGGAAWNLVVEFAEKRYPASCLLADPRSGVTLLKIQATPTPFLTIGNSDDLKVASPLVALGHPLDQPVAPSFGLVGGFDQRILDHYLPLTHIRADVMVQAGEQGAPMLNAKGEVVGIVVGRIEYGAACIVLPIKAAEKVRNDFMRFGEPRPGWVGVTLAPMGAGDTSELKVVQIAQDGPAAQTGLQEGDVLMKVGNTPIHRPGDLRDASFYLTADEIVPVTVRRGEQTLIFPMRAARPPGIPLSVNPPKAPEGMKLSLPHGP